MVRQRNVATNRTSTKNLHHKEDNAFASTYLLGTEKTLGRESGGAESHLLGINTEDTGRQSLAQLDEQSERVERNGSGPSASRSALLQSSPEVRPVVS